MRILLHIGPDVCGAARLQSVLAERRDTLARQGVLFPRSAGRVNHTRLWMAVTSQVDPLRHARGFADDLAQGRLYLRLAEGLADEVARHRPDLLVLSAAQLCWLSRPGELERLRDLLTPLSPDIEVLSYADDPDQMLARVYAGQIREGRARALHHDLALQGDWWDAALAAAPEPLPARGIFATTEGAPFWLDQHRLERYWRGLGRLRIRTYDADLFNGPELTNELQTAFGIRVTPENTRPAAPPSAATLTRQRQFNALIQHALAKEAFEMPRPLWRDLLSELAIDGPPLTPPDFTADWQEPDPQQGFRPAQYLAAFQARIRRAQPQKRPPAPELSDAARAVMPPRAIENFEALKHSRFAPHNRIIAVDETQLAAPYDIAAPHALPKGSSGTVIVGCMKNEAPYVLEWVAYHRAIGVDQFLIYSNGCDDGTREILERLQALGLLHHRHNDDWRGKSPQQFALKQSLTEPLIQQAEWIIHIDVDEFINVRCGNGTLPDFLSRVPDATNVAMTWRLFGHNGVTGLADRFVIDQFDTCAPAYCPKPHTVWGFKTMSKNIGAYGKISCHRPNQLAEGAQVSWVNGSGRDITRDMAQRGWRSSVSTVGYDLLQLNHYALRSAESFLIKRQRGRALHVDRAIGLNYWIRMDWSVHRDVTIKRNLHRLHTEFDRLMQDPELARLHRAGLDWHRDKADELRSTPEFQQLYDQVTTLQLTAPERVAYALALNMDS